MYSHKLLEGGLVISSKQIETGRHTAVALGRL